MESLESTNRRIIAQSSKILERIYTVSCSCFEKELLDCYWVFIEIEFLTMGYQVTMCCHELGVF